MSIRFTPIPTEIVRAYQAGSPDANGQPPERHVSDGDDYGCRHCLKRIPKAGMMLLIAHRPFPGVQPYAEVGPLFLCAEPCSEGGGGSLPDILTSTHYIVRGYSAADRIIYGTGGVIATDRIATRAADLLADPAVAYVHVRSARNNCYQVRIDRG